ncbi:ATP-binding protein [Streptomyces axinellae]|uniref:Histidine kinase/HSP90-like ATPase domain-containing protein n=1 Tax=Streptomyces axinellae TaxID=552788 RepID=A0ABN3QH54_9ACTN
MHGAAAPTWAAEGPEYRFEAEYQTQHLPQLRWLVRSWIHQRGLDILAPDVALIATELCSNLRHVPDRYGEVELRALDAGLRLSVRDRSEALPVVPSAPPCVTATSGRGLLVAALTADRFQIEAVAGGNVIWAEVRAPSEKGAVR